MLDKVGTPFLILLNAETISLPLFFKRLPSTLPLHTVLHSQLGIFCVGYLIRLSSGWPLFDFSITAPVFAFGC
jgi:hypothetical protein